MKWSTCNITQFIDLWLKKVYNLDTDVGGVLMIIVPMRDLKDTVKIENLCANENGPVFVTKNGYGKLVVMDIEYFEKIINQIFEAKAINEGLSDIEEGRLKNGITVREEMKNKYGF